MFFDEKPRDHPRSFAPGNPATLVDVWNTSRQSQQKIYNEFAITRQLGEEYGSRIDAVEKATGQRFDKTTPHPMKNGGRSTGRARIRPLPPSTSSNGRWIASIGRLTELAEKHPDTAEAKRQYTTANANCQLIL